MVAQTGPFSPPLRPSLPAAKGGVLACSSSVLESFPQTSATTQSKEDKAGLFNLSSGGHGVV